MADNSAPVSDFKVAIVKLEEVKLSAAGKPYLRMNLVHEDGANKTFFSGVAFGPLANFISKKGAKGNRMKVSGLVSQKEYVNKEGKPGIENKLVVQSAVIATNNGPVVFDEFATQ